MPSIVEYRIPLNMSVDEYRAAQLFSVARESENQTTGEDGVEIVKNEPFEDVDAATGKKINGQYTYKIYHLGKRMPGWIAKLLPKNVKSVYEEAWNAYPNCKTVITSPAFGKKFEIKIETRHLPYDPAAGFVENALDLDKDMLKKRKVEVINIATDTVDDKKCPEPSAYKSTKTGRGPLTAANWYATATPCMVAYKLCSVTVAYAMVGGKAESWIQGFEKNLFTSIHKKIFCWTDDWFGLSLDDIRRMEDETRERNRAKLAAIAEAGKDGKVSSAPAAEVDTEDPSLRAAAAAAAAGDDTADPSKGPSA
eukprot:TRINITY_DN1462_c0_g1_i1.p1 TRINITY_DN1462_c0_g1~~TRINITY_DN1462_c0_g1_i1.p1  ORF type:complete len:309 (+),score=92.72 TRINITY_DN1462_c0_g1_i1:223-1149(+)